ncbi:Holliday junction branch migration DNA helicase RuvB [Simkania negevensis]|uniref:Holliday junction branch migration complex subunit RuvB n=1 Tax=Simkania negevensis TaxID=83561 RepID=A0ABS3AR62_9BACT|nr:Holliday junction branch migration DNA helicase RuvB [Simkania negevensis]
MSQGFIESSWSKEDPPFEVPLRPLMLTDFVGQEDVRERLQVVIDAAQHRGDALGHCLFHGPPGLGKTTLANILAKAMNANIVITSGPVIEKAGDLAGLLTNLADGDLLFIDEIHRLNRTIEEYLYPAMEEFSLDLLIDSGPNARSVQVKLNRFTLVGATTRMGLLTSPMRSRFSLMYRLNYYRPEDLVDIIQRSSRILNVKMSQDAAEEIAKRARGTPRIANHLLHWVRDYAQVRAQGDIDKETALKALTMLDIDDVGLDEMDKKILEVMVRHYDGGPVGLNTLAAALNEEKATIEEVYEPFLINQGFIKRTPRGRLLTPKAYKHMNCYNI